MENLSPNQRATLEFIQKKCLAHGVTLFISPEPGVEYRDSGIICNGYFTDKPMPQLVVATAKPVSEWFLVLIHEYSHMMQWLEQDLNWTSNTLASGQEASDIIDEWLNNTRELSEEELTKLIQIIINLEIDCERRALNLINNLNLEINPIEYAQKANAYVLFYHVVKKNRKWYKIGQEPYSIEEVWKTMPSHLNLDYTKITPQQEQSFIYCFLDKE